MRSWQGPASGLLSALLLPMAWAGQVPGTAAAPDIPISHQDRVYSAEQFSNTVSVTDPADNSLLGVIRLGDTAPGNLSPLYRGQLLVHGLGFSPDHRTLVAVSIGSNAVSFIDTNTNEVKHTTYVGRSPHEAFFTPNGEELWVTVRGEDYISVLDPHTYSEKLRITVPGGPGMQIFSPDGRYGYVCSSFNPETVVITVADHKIVGRVTQPSPFCPNIAATPDGTEVWLTLKDVGKVMAFDAHPPFAVIRTIDTGPITNHVNFVRHNKEQFAYVTVGGLNLVKVFRVRDGSQVTSIPVGKMPHGVWPSGDGKRVYVGIENGDSLTAIDAFTNKVMSDVPVGQAPQAVVYVPGAVAEGAGMAGLQPLGMAGDAAHLAMAPTGGALDPTQLPTSVTLFDQGLLQVLQVSATGLQPKQPYVLALAEQADGSGVLQPLASFRTNPAGAAIVNAIGPLRQIVEVKASSMRRFLVIASGPAAHPGAIVQVQVP